MVQDVDAKVLQTALSNIRRKGFIPTEDNLLAAIAEPRSPMELYWATIALGSYGTEKSIPTLKSLVDYPKQDVKITTVHQLAKIAGAKETAFYCDLLASTTYREKGTAMWIIADVADETAVPRVIAYFEKNRAKLKKLQLTNNTCMDGAIYLFRMRNVDPAAEAFLDANLGLLLDNTDQIEQRGWNLIHGHPKNEWVAELFALVGRALPSYISARPA